MLPACHVLRLSPQSPSLSEVARLHQRCFEQGWDVAKLREVLCMPGAAAFVAQSNPLQCMTEGDHPEEWQSLGLLIVQQIAGEADIVTLAVAPEFRRQGLATRLMMEASEILNFPQLFLEVAIDNLAGQKLYEKLGFCRIGVRKAYYTKSHGCIDAITYKLVR
jgi:ribosomal-protein-alanine N-acetyltransferase